MTDETKPTEETVETLEEETVEEVRDPVAILRKNKQLLADLKAAKERSSSLEELARTLGGDEALVDPKAFIAKRAEDTKAAEHRARVVREAVLTKLIDEQRTVKGAVEDLVKTVLADPAVTLVDGKVTGLDAALSIAPKKASPGPPGRPVRGWDEATGTYRSSAGPAPRSFEELQAKGTAAVQAFAAQAPGTYQALKADFDKRLAKPERRG